MCTKLMIWHFTEKSQRSFGAKSDTWKLMTSTYMCSPKTSLIKYPIIKLKKIKYNEVTLKQFKLILFPKLFPVISRDNKKNVDSMALHGGAHDHEGLWI